MSTPEQEFYNRYLKEAGGNHESAFFAVMAQMNETLERVQEQVQCGRGTCPGIPEEQMQELVEQAAAKAVEKLSAEFYTSVGKTVISRTFFIVGGLAVASVIYLKSKGWL